MSKGGGGAGGSTIIQSGQPIIINAQQNDHEMNQKIKRMMYKILEEKEYKVNVSHNSMTNMVKIVDTPTLDYVVNLCLPCDLILFYYYYRRKDDKIDGITFKGSSEKDKEFHGALVKFFQETSTAPKESMSFKLDLLPRTGESVIDIIKGSDVQKRNNLKNLLNIMYDILSYGKSGQYTKTEIDLQKITIQDPYKNNTDIQEVVKVLQGKTDVKLPASFGKRKNNDKIKKIKKILGVR